MCNISVHSSSPLTDLRDLFYKSWEKQGIGSPTIVEGLLKILIELIVISIENTNLESKYKQRVREIAKVTSPSEKLLFHGTSAFCKDLGLCGGESCGVCGIVKNGFKLSYR